MGELTEAYAEFWDGLLRDADATGEPLLACFFSSYAPLAAENGDCNDLTYTPVRREGAQGFQIDGYAIDAERGELHLAVSDFRQEPELQSLNQATIDSLCRRAERFVIASMRPEFINALEESSPAFQAAQPIFEHRASVTRVRVVLFSNARLASRKKGVEARELSGKTFTFNLLDFTRYVSIQDSRGGSEPIEINLSDLGEAPLECLEAHAGSEKYAAYLIAMPGELLAKIYGLYGARLLEQNVRTFLQARTKVNKGILETLSGAPEMFFAYNNGLTATASSIDTTRLESGRLAISSLTNLQIVNGGQTTASILYAKDQSRVDLQNVYVQVKLSVISPADIETIVPKISRFANTQNRINEADFFSSHPFHLEIERISRRLPAPQKVGAFSSSKWFYERARGQYKDKLAYGTQAAKTRFQTEFPKDQVITKTDLAKTELTFQCEPHLVSQGEQKCFLEFADRVGKDWESRQDSFNEAYFRDAVARTIIFRWTDLMIARAEWYKGDRGYKAQTVTYTIAWVVNFLMQSSKAEIDLRQVWKAQEVGEDLRAVLSLVAPQVALKIRAAPPEMKNIGEYCKRQLCWAQVSKLDISLDVDWSRLTIDRSEAQQRRRESLTSKKLLNEVEFDVLLVNLVAIVPEIRTFAEARHLLSPKSAAGLAKMASGRLVSSGQEKNALRLLFEQMREAGFEFPRTEQEPE